MSTEDSDGDYWASASLTDVPEIAALARAELPSMTSLHSEAGWTNFNRFGRGQQVRGNCTLILRDGGPDGPLIGVIWADDAMYTDHGIAEPWWCINALAIAPQFRGKGRGSALVSEVSAVGAIAGVALLYGQSVPNAVSFWKELGCVLADDGESIGTHKPARRVTGEKVMLMFEPGPGDRFFVKYLTSVPGSVRSGLLPAAQLRSLREPLKDPLHGRP